MLDGVQNTLSLSVAGVACLQLCMLAIAASPVLHQQKGERSHLSKSLVQEVAEHLQTRQMNLNPLLQPYNIKTVSLQGGPRLVSLLVV